MTNHALLGIFMLNPYHNIVHIAIGGLWLIAAFTLTPAGTVRTVPCELVPATSDAMPTVAVHLPACDAHRGSAHTAHPRHHP